MIDILLCAILVFIIALAILYVYNAKKNGKSCIGCPHACSCKKKDEGYTCSCASNKTK